MPTIKTIKPAGGGDYTTLAAWWSARRTSGNAAEWAECYGGGDLGYAQFDASTTTPDASNYMRIYAAPGHRHNGIDPTSGAHFTSPDDRGLVVYFGNNYARVEGIAGQVADQQWSTVFAVAFSHDVILDGCLAVGHGSSDNSVGFGSYMSSASSVTYRNCIARDYADPAEVNQGATGFYAQNSSGAGGYTVTFENCTAYNCNHSFLIGAAP